MNSIESINLQLRYLEIMKYLCFASYYYNLYPTPSHCKIMFMLDYIKSLIVLWTSDHTTNNLVCIGAYSGASTRKDTLQIP